MRAMILAAGRGERLRPLTDTTPKPLIEVGGKSLIVCHLEKLAQAGFEEIVINLAWLGDRIHEALGDGRPFGLRLHYSREPEQGLETAGGIIQALDLLGNAPFLVVNGDIVTDYDFSRLHGHHPQGLAHLVMVDNPGHHPDGDFSLNGQQLRSSGEPRLTFSGIGVYRPEMFAGLEPGERPLRPLFDQAVNQGRLTGEYHPGLWADIGTPERLEQVRRQMAASR